MRHLLHSFYLFFFPFYTYGQHTFQVVDRDTREPLPYVAYHSTNRICKGQSNDRGQITVDRALCDSLVLRLLGYQKKVIALGQLPLDGTVWLQPELFNLRTLDVVSTRVDVAEDLNGLLKKVRKLHEKTACSTYFFLESTTKDTLLERIEAVTLDQISVAIGLEQSSRKVGRFLFNTSHPFFSTDFDIALKSMSPFGEKPNLLAHWLNETKIKKGSDYKWTLLEENTATQDRLVAYRNDQPVNAQRGWVRYNTALNQIQEHRVVFNKIAPPIFKALNQQHQLIADSMLVHQYFTDNQLDFMAFHLYITLIDNGVISPIQTSGFIQVRKDTLPLRKLIVPKGTFRSLQDELTLTPHPFLFSIEEIRPPIVHPFTFFQNTKGFVTGNDSLAYSILRNFDAVEGNRQMWSAQKRLTLDDFQNAQVSTLKRTVYFDPSDFTELSTMWIVNPVYEAGKVVYYALPTLWERSTAIIPYHAPMQAEILANLTFDIFEIYRRRALEAIKAEAGNNVEKALTILENYYDNAHAFVQKMYKESKSGNDLRKLLNYNRIIKDNIGIDNVGRVLAPIELPLPDSEEGQNNLDYLAANQDTALGLYEEIIQNRPMSDATKGILLFQMAHILLKAEDRAAACKYYQNALRHYPALSSIGFKAKCP